MRWKKKNTYRRISLWSIKKRRGSRRRKWNKLNIVRLCAGIRLFVTSISSRLIWKRPGQSHIIALNSQTDGSSGVSHLEVMSITRRNIKENLCRFQKKLLGKKSMYQGN
jgi:hypothetical protein